MKFKIIYRATYILSAVCMFYSCEGFLDKNPLDQMSNETFWTSEDEVEMALTGCYSRLNDQPYFGWMAVDLDALTDNVQHKYTDDAILSISRGEIEVTTGGVIDEIWSGAYTGISTCNNFLENVDNVDFDDDTRNQYVGEVRFLRAFFYFQLVHYFGDVILYEINPETIEGYKIAQSSKEEVLEFIHADLDSAISYLPDDDYSDGHAVWGSAMAFKARVLMYEENYEEALNITNEIIQSGTFELDNDYDALFISPQTNSNEIMFSVCYSEDDDYTDMDVDLITWGKLMPRQELVDEYECTDGKSIEESSLYDPENPYQNRDPRLAMSIMTPDVVWYNPDGTEHIPDESQTGFFQIKYVDKSKLPITSSTQSDQDYVVLRYADVLLMYAEAKNEVSGPDQSVYDAINEIRSRPDVDMPDIESGLSQNEMREVIRHERRIELALEGLRYYDLKRWKIAHTVMPEVNDVGGANIVFKNPKHYLWPYQEGELELNPNLEPNPDYVY